MISKGVIHQQPSQSGFTLVEIIIVIVLLGILAAAVLPKAFSTSTYTTRLYFDSVLNSVEYARKLAVGTGQHIQVALSTSTLTLSRRTEGSNCTTGTVLSAVVDPSTNATTFVKTAPSGITLSPAITFYFDGLGKAYLVSGTATTCAALGTQVITVQGNFSATVTIVGETGFVQGAG